MYPMATLPLDLSDRDLERRVSNFLAARNLPTLRRLQVAADRGTVTLRGRVHSFYEKQLCQHACRRVAGVISMVDAIDVA
jgi:osmotically-inducible protein OsmY